MRNIEADLKTIASELDDILKEYERLNSETKCKHIAHERALEREIILLEELLNNLNPAKRWRDLLESDKRSL